MPPRGRGRGRGGRGASRGGGFLARTRRDPRTFRFTLEEPEPALDVRQLHHYHPLAGVSLATCSEPPYCRLPIGFAPCQPVVLGDDLVHIRLLEDVGFVCPKQYRRPVVCRHVRQKLRKRADVFGGVCDECRPGFVKANVPIAGHWMPLGLCIEHGVLPADKRPSPLWPLFRASAPSEAPWKTPVRMAALGHLAPVPQHTLDDLHDSFPPEFAQLAADINMPLHLLANALWRLFGTNEVSQRAAQFEMALVDRVTAWPDCIYSVEDRVVSRTEWKRFADLFRDRHVRRVRPIAATVEYPAIRTSLDLMLASDQLARTDHTDVAWVHIAGEDVSLGAVSDLISACQCPLALTVEDDVCHPVHHLLSIADTFQ